MRCFTSLRRKTAVLVLTAVLAAPVAGFATPKPQSLRAAAAAVEAAPLKLLRLAWSLLQGVWSEPEPSGVGLSSPAPKKADEGCGIDPNGRCLSSPVPTADEGCGIDPSGHCNS